jgi:2-methylisocitrate lyase-like PEP mutase family enzyme
MAHSINGMAERLREKLETAGAFPLAGCYDVLSAMLLRQAGFSAIFLSGYGVAASLLGNPDIGLTSLSETAAAAKNTISAVHDVPIIVDADNGYGNEDNVIRTVYELEYAGAAGMIMEDQVLPKRCGHTDDKKILPLPLYMRKLECALKSRQTPMVVVARTDSMDLDDAIARAKDFHSAGADVTLVDGLKSLEDVKRIGDEIPGHKQINLIWGGKTPALPVPELGKLGFKIVLYSTPALFTMAKTLQTTMRRLFETQDLSSIGPESISFKEFQLFVESSYRERPHSKPLGSPRPSQFPPEKKS